MGCSSTETATCASVSSSSLRRSSSAMEEVVYTHLSSFRRPHGRRRSDGYHVSLALLRHVRSRRADEPLVPQFLGRGSRDLADEVVDVVGIRRLALPTPHQLVLFQRVDQRLDGDDRTGSNFRATIGGAPAVAVVAAQNPE